MASRWARFVRGWLTAGISVFVAAVSHVAGGGAAPGLLGVVLAMAFAGILCVALAGKSLSRVRLGVSVAASQFAFHLLFSLGTGPAASVMSNAGHGHQHTAVLLTAGSAPASTMTMHNDPSMWAAHAFAALITVVLLRRGETAFWQLLELARTAWVAVAVPRFVAVGSMPVDGTRVRIAIADLSGLRDLGIVLSGQPRRGPPSLQVLTS